MTNDEIKQMNNAPTILNTPNTVAPYTPTTPNTKFQTHSPSPIYGIRPGFDISDLPATGDAVAIPSLTGVSTTTTSATLAIQCRSLELDVQFNTKGASCQVDIYTAADSYAAPVFTQIVSQTTADSVYAGNYEGVNLNGYNVKIKVSSISAGTVSVQYRLGN